MRIAVNARFLLHGQLEGIGTFSHEVLQRVVKLHPQHEFIFLFDRPYHESFIYADNVKPVVLFPPARHPVLFVWWFEFSVAMAIKKYKADLFFSPDGYLSLR
ncbi:MAG: glycosyltransferase family 1 protein, partial [Bacteroidia bacterium]